MQDKSVALAATRPQIAGKANAMRRKVLLRKLCIVLSMGFISTFIAANLFAADLELQARYGGVSLTDRVYMESGGHEAALAGYYSVSFAAVGPEMVAAIKIIASYDYLWSGEPEGFVLFGNSDIWAIGITRYFPFGNGQISPYLSWANFSDTYKWAPDYADEIIINDSQSGFIVGVDVTLALFEKVNVVFGYKYVSSSQAVLEGEFDSGRSYELYGRGSGHSVSGGIGLVLF